MLVHVINEHHPITVSGNPDSFSVVSTRYDVRKFMFRILHDAVFPTSNLHTNAHAPRVPM